MEAEAALTVPVADWMQIGFEQPTVTSRLVPEPLVSRVLCGTFAGQVMFSYLARADM